MIYKDYGIMFLKIFTTYIVDWVVKQVFHDLLEKK